MPKTADSSGQEVVHRLFIIQIALVVIFTLLTFLAYAWPERVGSYFFAAILGCLGGSITLLRRVKKDHGPFAEELAASWIATLMPLLYAGLMASVAYLLFMSGIVSGDGGNGLLSSNLFPNFTNPNPDGAELLSFKHVAQMRPASLQDLGKLMVWCFLAGYSERFVIGILKQLERKGGAVEKS